MFSQQIGDYKSVASGTWTTVSNWQVYNGTTWVAASQNPGQTSGTYSVTISAGTTIDNYPGTLSFGDLIVYGTLRINSNFTLNTTKKTLNIWRNRFMDCKRKFNNSNQRNGNRYRIYWQLWFANFWQQL